MTLTIEQGIFFLVALVLFVAVTFHGKQLGLISVHERTLQVHGRKLDQLTTAITEISTLCEVHFGNPHGGENLVKLKAAIEKLQAEASNPYGFQKVQD